jgi:hypothetical protein
MAHHVGADFEWNKLGSGRRAAWVAGHLREVPKPVGTGWEEGVTNAMQECRSGLRVRFAKRLVAKQSLNAAPLVPGRHSRAEVATRLATHRSVPPILVQDSSTAEDAIAGMEAIGTDAVLDGPYPFHDEVVELHASQVIEACRTFELELDGLGH